MDKIKAAAEALKASLLEVDAIGAEAEKANRDLTDDERARVTAGMEKAKELKGRYDTLKADAQMTAEIKAMGLDIGLADDVGLGSGDPLQPAGRKGTIGERFVDSPEFKNLLAMHPGGRVSQDASVRMNPVAFDALVGRKALVTGASQTSGGALVDPDYIGIQSGSDLFKRPLTIRDIVTTATTTSDLVSYVRVTSFTNAASPVAESTATADPGSMVAANGVKPESTLALAEVTAAVQTIAHWIPATKRALSDAGQIRSLIDDFLRYGLDEELEDQMVTGDGTGTNFAGLTVVSGTQAQAWDTDILTTTRKARTLVRTVGRSVPTAYVLNPADWQTIDLLQDNEARYFFGGPQQLGQPRLWGLPVVESEAMPAGTGMVGDFRQAVLWDREQAAITVSDSHANFFIRNMVAILAEMRAAFGVLRPLAFVEIDLTA